MLFPSDAKCYKSYDDEYIVLTNDGLGDNNYFSPDGIKFYQWKQRGYGTGGGLSFEDPGRGTMGRVSFVKDYLVIEDGRPDKRIYRAAPVPEKGEIVPLPHIRVCRSFGDLPKTGELFYVSCDHYYGKPLKFFKGFPGAMKEIIGEFLGSSKVVTNQGILECPSKSLMTWEGIQLGQTNPRYYEIVETEDGLQIVALDGDMWDKDFEIDTRC